MTASLSGRPLWRLVFDADGDPDQTTVSALTDGVTSSALTDLVMFSHGWNNDEATASSLYERWFALLAAQVEADRKIGFVGIRWPSELWRDEPIPNFEPLPAPAFAAAAVAVEAPTVSPGPPTIDPVQLADLQGMFPSGAAQLETIAGLLEQVPTDARASEIFTAMQQFSLATASGFNDGEADPATLPGMLAADQDPTEMFTRFADRLAESAVDVGGGGGAAGLSDLGGKILNGAKEALRQLTYWQMKNRAGTVGQHGLGPVIGRLAGAAPALRVHLIGHSFGARVVSFALAGLPDLQPSPIKSVTLLEGAYSRFAFTDPLPFRDGAGALAGKLIRVDGPVAVCYSSHDKALGTFYPLASAAADDDAAGAEDPLARWRAIGAEGAYNAATQELGAVGTTYPFQTGQILNLDSSAVVAQGDSPSGAHSDIFYPQLAWVAAAAGGLRR